MMFSVFFVSSILAFLLGILGVFSPSISLFFLDKERQTRKFSALIFFGSFIVFLLIAVALSPKPTAPQQIVVKSTNSCNLPLKVIYQKDNQFYVSVKGFDTKNADCWSAIEDFIKGREDFIIHFVDATEFEPSPLTAEKRKLVVAQWVKQLGLVPDPFAYGIYTK